MTHGLVLHAGEDDVEHLGEGGFRGRLVDEVLAGQVDVVARSDGLQHRALVDLDVLGGHRRQQGLGTKKEETFISLSHITRNYSALQKYLHPRHSVLNFI